MTQNTFVNILDRHFKMNQDYAFDVLQDLCDAEAEVLQNYSNIQVDPEQKVSARNRKKLVEWMVETSDELKLTYKTKHTAIMIVDLALLKLKIHKNFLQLLGVTSLFISIKCEESFIYGLEDACKLCADTYSKEEVSAMEMLLYKTLKWKLQYPTPGEISRRLVNLTNAVPLNDFPAFQKKVDNFTDLCLSEYEVIGCPPTCIAATSIMCAFENSQYHVEEWRRMMIENNILRIDFNIVDQLYQNIIEKVLRYCPNYFAAAAEKNNNQQALPADFTPINIPQIEIYPFMDSNNQLNFVEYAQEASGLSLGSQETYIEPNKYGEIILESFSLAGTPIQYKGKTCEDFNASLLKTEKLMRTAASSMQDEDEDQNDCLNSNAMELEKDF